LANKVAGVPGRLCVEVGERLTVGLGDVKHRCGSESNESLRPLFRRCLVVVTVTVLVVARRVLALRALFRDDRCPDPDGRLALRDVAVELLLPRPVARHPARFWILALDEERIPVGVVVEATLDVEPLLELFAGLRVVDAGDELVDPLFDRTVHLVVSRVGLLEGDRRGTSRSHCVHRIKFTATASVQDAPHPLGRKKPPRGYRSSWGSSAKPTVTRYSRNSSKRSTSLGVSVARCRAHSIAHRKAGSVPPFAVNVPPPGRFQHDQRIRRRLLTGEPTGDGFDFVGDIDRFDLR